MILFCLGILIPCIFPISGQIFGGTLQRFDPINSQDFETDRHNEIATVLLKQIHDHSAFKSFFVKIENFTLQPLIDCLKNPSNCSYGDVIQKLDLIQIALDTLFTRRYHMDSHCSADLSNHWASVIKLAFAGAFELSCVLNKSLSVCNENGTTSATIQSILNENLWALIRKL